RRTSGWSAVLLRRSLRHGYDGDVGAAFCFGTELNSAINQREQRVVLAHPDVGTGVPLGAALARENVAGDGFLAAEHFDAEAPARRIAAVARRPACLFMSHGRSPEVPEPYTDSVTESSLVWSRARIGRMRSGCVGRPGRGR